MGKVVAVNGRNDSSQCVIERLVLPNSKDGPPRVFQSQRLSPISVTVPPDLCIPELTIRGGHLPMFRATVPKAAVDENSNTTTGEHDVGPDTNAADDHTEVFPKSHASTMEC